MRPLKHHYHNKNGFSLVEVLITTAIMGVMALGIGQLVIDMAKQTTRLEDRIEMLQTQNLIQGLFLNSTAVCSCNLRPDAIGAGSKKKFNANAAAKEKLTYNEIRSGCDSADPVIVGIGQALTPRLTIDAIEMTNFKKPATISDPWLGEFVVHLTSPGKVLHPIVVPMSFAVDTSGGASAATIAGCELSATGGGEILNGTLGDSIKLSNITAAQEMTSDCLVKYSGSGKGCGDEKGYLSYGKTKAAVQTTGGNENSCSHSECDNARVTGFQSTEIFVPKGQWIRSNKGSKCFDIKLRCAE